MTQEIRKLQELNLKNTILSTHFIQESIDIPELEQLGNLNSENEGEPDVVSSLFLIFCVLKSNNS